MVALFVASMSLAVYVKDARIEQAIDDLVDEFALERDSEKCGEIIACGMSFSTLYGYEFYSGEPISLEHQERIIDKFRDVCSDEQHMVRTVDSGLNPADGTSIAPTFTAHTFIAPDNSVFTEITIVFYDEGGIYDDGRRSSAVRITRIEDEPSRWDRLKALLPW